MLRNVSISLLILFLPLEIFGISCYSGSGTYAISCTVGCRGTLTVYTSGIADYIYRGCIPSSGASSERSYKGCTRYQSSLSGYTRYACNCHSTYCNRYYTGISASTFISYYGDHTVLPKCYVNALMQWSYCSSRTCYRQTRTYSDSSAITLRGCYRSYQAYPSCHHIQASTYRTQICVCQTDFCNGQSKVAVSQPVSKMLCLGPLMLMLNWSYH